MKILVVCQFYYPENFTITNICEKLASFGHDVTVLTGKPNYGFNEILPEYKNINFELINGVKINRVNIKPRNKKRFSIINNYLSFWLNSKKWVRKCKEKFDAVYAMSLSPITILSAGALYRKKHNCKYVVHCVDLWPESPVITKAIKKNSIIYKILHRWSKKLYQKADEILIGSPSFKDYFIKELNINDKKFVFVPQCSLVEEISKENKVKLSDGFNMVYCGNIGTIQSVERIPEIMSYVKNKNLFFHIIGMGVKVPQLLENIKKYHMEDRVIYHGPKRFTDAVDYIAASDALYVYLTKEGYVGNTIPNKLTMYLTFSKPIVVSLKGDGYDVAKNAGGAFLAGDDSESIAKQIDSISQLDEKEFIKLGKKNRLFYDENFSCEKISRMIEKELMN